MADRGPLPMLPTSPPQKADEAIAACEPLCNVLASKYYAAGLERQDLVQLARIGAWRAWRDWNSELAIPFGAFARLCIERQLITALKTARRGKHEILNAAASIDAPTTDEGDGSLADVIPLHGADPHATLLARDEVRRLLTAIRTLSDVEQIAVVGLAIGLSYREIADHLDPHQWRGTPTKTIDNALQRAARKLADRDLGVLPAALVQLRRRRLALPREAA